MPPAIRTFPLASPNPAAGTSCARAFSLLELMIAVGILGIGLIMVAAIFPVALDQHRRTTDQTLASDTARRAEAVILTKGLNTPSNAQELYYAVPFNNEPDPTQFRAYITGLNQGSVSPIFELADVLYPYEPDAIVRDQRPCYVWLAFVGPTQGVQQYTVFVCKRTPGQRFALQDTTDMSKLRARPQDSDPDYADVYYPAPWKIPVRLPAVMGKDFNLDATPKDLTLDQLIRNGSRLLSQKTGKLYTVVATTGAGIAVLEDVSLEGNPGDPLNLWFIPGPVDPAVDRTVNPTANRNWATFGRAPVIDVLTFAGPAQ